MGQQYSYIERLEALLASMQPDRLSSHLRADLQLLHLGKPLPWEGQRLAALKARSAVAARCQRACQVSIRVSMHGDCSQALCSCGVSYSRGAEPGSLPSPRLMHLQATKCELPKHRPGVAPCFRDTAG